MHTIVLKNSENQSLNKYIISKDKSRGEYMLAGNNMIYTVFYFLLFQRNTVDVDLLVKV